MADKPHDFIDQYQALVRGGLEAWSRQFDPAADGASPSADIMGRMFNGLGGYGDWMRSVAGGAPAEVPFAGAGVPPFGAAGPGVPPFGASGPGMPPFGYGPPPGATAAPGSESFDDWARVARETLSMPAFGLNREQQEEQQALLRAWIDYAEQQARYQALLQGVNDRAMAALREQVPPAGPDSMRAMYDRWVNLAEESYAEAALSQEFRDVYAALANAQMRLKVLQQGQVERLAVQAGMPTRREVDSLGERLQSVRRELRQMHGLAAEVASLKAELAALRGSAPAQGPANGVGAKAGAAQKRAMKKTAANGTVAKTTAARKTATKKAATKKTAPKGGKR